MVAGKPRTVSLPPNEMIELGKEMISWVTKNKKTILHLSEWYCIEKEFTEKQWDTFQQREEFIPYYEKALKIVGSKYLDKNSNVRESASHRWQRVYFKDLKKEEDETARFNAELRKADVKADREATIEAFKEMIQTKRDDEPLPKT